MSRRIPRSRGRWGGRPGQATSTIPLEAEPDEIDTDDLETDGIEAEVIDQDEIDEDETEADEAEPEEVDHRRARGSVRMQRADAVSPSRSRSRRSRPSMLENREPEPRRRRVPWLRMLGAGMLVIGLAALTLGLVRPWIASSVTTYTTSTVTFGDIIATSVATGTVEASTVYGLKFGSSPDIVSSTSTTSGSGGAVTSGWTGSQAQSLNWPVKTVVVTQGQKVKQGDVLATADSSDAQVALLSAQANLGLAQSRLTDDQAAKTRSSTILQDRAQVASAQASYDRAKAAASQDQLVAPADGLVIAVNILPGVNAPSGYAIEVESGSLVAVASFTESDVNKLEPGQPATISVTAVDTSVPGVVASIAPAPTSATDGSSSSVGGGSQSSVVAYAVRVTLTSPPEKVRAGMTTTVTITTGSAISVMRVPASAVSGSASTGYTVRVVQSDGSVSSVAVGIGLVTSSWVEITYGLSTHDTLVTGTSATRNGTTNGNGGFQLPGLGGGGFVPR